MLKYNFIGISYQSIRGVVNPGLTLIGTVKKDNYKFKVLVDGEERKSDLVINPYSGEFTLKVLLDKSCKNIYVYVLCDGKEYLIYRGKNTRLRRLNGKIKDVVANKLKLVKSFFITLFKGIRYLWRDYHFLVPPKMWKKYFNDFKKRVRERGNNYYYEPFNKDDYNRYLAKNKLEVVHKDLEYRPLISILIPVYNIGREYLARCLDSILNQTYDNFEVCLVDDCSTKEETLDTLKEYSEKDPRIHVSYHKKNKHISETTNDALKMAEGEFISLVDDDDELDKDALYMVVEALNENKELDFIYTDEDKIDLDGKYCEPHFKADYSPDTLLSNNYICHFTTIRKSKVEEVGGFEKGLEGAQDYDLFLKVTEVTNNIYHIPEVLYHWRKVEGSTSMTIDNKSYAIDKGALAVSNALKRRGIKGNVVKDEKTLYYKVNYILDKEPKVSILIPTKDYADSLEMCLKSLYEKTTYKNYEVIVMNNQSEKEETFELFESYKKKHKNFKVIDAPYPFNYSKINNDGVKVASGEFICLLNNDTEIISPDWLSVMVSYAAQSHVGAVGAKLLYPDDTVQHAGVILGLGGVASHAFIGASKEDAGMYGRLMVPYNYAAVTAACLVVSKEKYLSVGGLEKDLKVAYNDVDFNLKLLEKGLYNVVTPQVMLHHFESKTRGFDTTPEKYELFKKEQNYMFNKWGKIIADDPFYNKHFSKQISFKLKK